MGELKRRAVHLAGTGFPAIYLLEVVTWRQLQALLIAGTAAVFLLEFLRLVVEVSWGPLNRVYDELTREYEADNVAGYALFMVGATAAALAFAPPYGPESVAFEPPLAVPAILMLSIGDPVSGYLGSNDATTAKEVGVLGVMFLVCFALAVPFTVLHAGEVVGVAAAVAGALGATVADGLKPVIRGYVIDDNLTISPASGAAMTAVLVLAA
ncbi:dolichol kinase [Halobaculum sp. CBA1158]|uniref:dolichol kinase n=1 Tax=Halobaculum sp. CBA1158 TaxID=2904243 RepID=UPI001F2A1727|nr:dolichol kinase [Halobaculum sp. CBA1158]UIP00057.1 dolichol kinase [Halobaculum sp. CBA1158]